MKIKVFFALSVLLLVILLIEYGRRETSPAPNPPKKESVSDLAQSEESDNEKPDETDEDSGSLKEASSEDLSSDLDEDDSAETIEKDNMTTGVPFKFSSKDFNGESVDESVFKGYDLVVVNLWEPWCNPCIEDMGNLQKLSRKNENILVLGVSDSPISDVKNSLEQNGIKYLNIQYSSDFDSMNSIGFYPTTFFVGRNGCPILKEKSHGAVIDALVMEYKDDYEAYLAGDFSDELKDKKLAAYIKYVESIIEDDDALKEAALQDVSGCLGNSGEFSVALSYEQWQMITDNLIKGEK